MSERERLAWLAILDNGHFARNFVEGFTLESFIEDRRTFYAVTRCLEIISEAARRLRGAQQSRFPNLEWREIESMGNVFRHAYDNVIEHRIWTSVHNDVPRIIIIADRATQDEYQ